jgi:hypothetical protein
MTLVNESITAFKFRTQIEDLQPRHRSNITSFSRKVDLFRNPSPLFEQQRKLQQQINTLFSERYDLILRHRKNDTPYIITLDEDRYHAERWSAESKADSEVGEKRKARALLS